MSILVMRGGALGDFVLTVPVLTALRAGFPGAEIHLLAYPHAGVLARAAGLADGFRSLDEAGASRLFSPDGPDARWAGWLSGFDAVICLLHDPDGVLAHHLRRSVRGRLILHGPMVPPGRHAADHFLEAVSEVCDRANPGTGSRAVPGIPYPSVKLPEAWIDSGRARLAAFGGECILIHPGSGGVRKNAPAALFAEVAARIETGGRRVPVFLFGEADGVARGQLLICLPGARRIESLTVAELAGVLAAGTGYLGNDSGVTHLAAAVGLPTVALFGPTDPAVWGPRGERVRILRGEGGGWGGLTADAICHAVGEGGG